MNRIDLAKAALNMNDPDQYSHFSDDFVFTDELGSPPQDRRTWLATATMTRAALPDLAHVIDGIHQEGDDVVVESHFTGTFTHDLDLSALGLGVIRATGEPVRMGSRRIRLSFDGDQVSRIHSMDTGPDAGVAGFLKALGANLG